MLFALAGLLLLASTSSTPAATGAAPAAQADAGAGGAPTKKEKKICRTLEADTGSRLAGRKVCKSREEWTAERDSRRLDRDPK